MSKLHLDHKSPYSVYSGSMKSKVQYVYQTCFEFREGRTRHPVSATIVMYNMSLTVSQYHLTLKHSSSVSKHTWNARNMFNSQTSPGGLSVSLTSKNIF